MPQTRAKFRCQSVESVSYDPSGELNGPRLYRFQAAYDETMPEDQRYAKYSPSGDLKIQVDNPAVVFKPGSFYYLDFTPVDEG